MTGSLYITDSSIAIFWDVIPHDIIRSILFKAANYLGYDNPRMMSTEDLKVSIPFLKGMSLYSFASRFFGLNRGGVRSIDYICDVYGVPELTYEEWLNVISYQKNFKWEAVPEPYIGRILQEKAREMGKSNPRLLKHEDLNTPTGFINNKTLTSLHAAYLGCKGSMDTISTCVVSVA